MSIRRYNASNSISNYFGGLENLFHEFFENSIDQYRTRSMRPWSESSENETHYLYNLAMPGIPKENIHVSLDQHNGQTFLNISGKSTQQDQGDQDGSTWSKLMSSSYSRSFSLPNGISDEDVSAKHEDGVLHLEIKKPNPSNEKSQKRITVS